MPPAAGDAPDGGVDELAVTRGSDGARGGQAAAMSAAETGPVTTGPAVVTVVGNPKPRSRTRAVAHRVAMAAAAAGGLPSTDPLEVDLARLGPQLFDWSSTDVRDAVAQ